MADIFNMADTWNNGATTFTAIKMNVTDTASNAAALLLDLQVGGSSRFKVAKNGTITTSSNGSGLVVDGSTGAGVTDNAFWKVNAFGFYNGTSGGYGFSSAGAIGTIDLFLLRDAANTLALRNGTNAQALRVYNTYTDASNWERLAVTWSSNTAFIYSENLGTGTNRNLTLGTSGAGVVNLMTTATNRWTVNGSGHFFAALDNTYDIGASGATRPRNGYFGGFVDSDSSFRLSSAGIARLFLASPSDGVLRLTNGAISDFNRLQLGGTTNSFGAIARDGAGISIVGGAGGSTAHIKVPGVTVANLPAAATAGAGARCFVTDALTPVFGSAVAGGGAVNVPVYSTGSAWNVG